MCGADLTFESGVVLVGGGALDAGMVDDALQLAPALVAADGGADRLAALGVRPIAIIGDMDSVSDPDAWQASGVALHVLREQDTTDFEKCLYSCSAPFYVGIGFTGRRMDHMLAVMHAMMVHANRTVILLGEEDAIALVPEGRSLQVTLDPDDRVSLFPLAPVRCLSSSGLRWPVDGMEMAPGRWIGTSNRARGGPVGLKVHGRGLFLFLDRCHAGALLAALRDQV